MAGRELRRSVTLAERFSAVDSSNMRDLLKVRDDDEGRSSRRNSVTLASVLAREQLESAAAADDEGGPDGGSGRTLLDIMRQEQEMNGNVATDGRAGNGINWKAFKDRIIHRRIANAWYDAAAAVPNHPAPLSDSEFVVPTPPNHTVFPSSISHSVSTRNIELHQRAPTSADGHATASEQNASATLVANTLRDPSPNGREVADGSNTGERSHLDDATLARSPAASVEDQQPRRVSLMALLEQTDGHWGGSPTPIVTLSAAAEAGNEANDHTEEHNGIRMIYICCVCMVRQKGAAFIPCGHTFCRLCSRELWVSRGSCPLCNGYILDILDIF